MSERLTGVLTTWAGDVSPALGGAMAEQVVTAVRPSVEVIHGSGRTEARKPE